MTQQNENLSAVVDGELKDDSLLSQVLEDKSLADKWQRYHLIRQGLRKEMPLDANFDISQQVAMALEEEPAILAPQRSWRNIPLVASVIPLARQGGQLAIAASVAVAMVLGVQQLNQPEVEQSFGNGPATLPGVQGGLSPVSLEQTRAVPRNDVLEQRRRINAYLTDHRQQLRIKTSEEEAIEKQNAESKTVSENPPE